MAKRDLCHMKCGLVDTSELWGLISHIFPHLPVSTLSTYCLIMERPLQAGDNLKSGFLHFLRSSLFRLVLPEPIRRGRSAPGRRGARGGLRPATRGEVRAGPRPARVPSRPARVACVLSRPPRTRASGGGRPLPSPALPSSSAPGGGADVQGPTEATARPGPLPTLRPRPGRSLGFLSPRGVRPAGRIAWIVLRGPRRLGLALAPEQPAVFALVLGATLRFL